MWLGLFVGIFLFFAFHMAVRRVHQARCDMFVSPLSLAPARFESKKQSTTGKRDRRQKKTKGDHDDEDESLGAASQWTGHLPFLQIPSLRLAALTQWVEELGPTFRFTLWTTRCIFSAYPAFIRRVLVTHFRTYPRGALEDKDCLHALLTPYTFVDKAQRALLDAMKTALALVRLPSALPAVAPPASFREFLVKAQRPKKVNDAAAPADHFVTGLARFPFVPQSLLRSVLSPKERNAQSTLQAIRETSSSTTSAEAGAENEPLAQVLRTCPEVPRESVAETLEACLLLGDDLTASLPLDSVSLPELRKCLLKESPECAAANGDEHKIAEAVVLETLRLYPPVPIVVRKVESDDLVHWRNHLGMKQSMDVKGMYPDIAELMSTKSGQLTIPSSCQIVLGIEAMHRMKELWGENANEFSAMRFLVEDRKIGGFAREDKFMPFGAGPSTCPVAKIMHELLARQLLRKALERN